MQEGPIRTNLNFSQDTSTELDPANLNALDEQITAAKNESKTLHNQLYALKNQPNPNPPTDPTVQLKAAIASLEEEKAILGARLAQARMKHIGSSDGPAEKEILKRRLQYWENTAWRRAKIRADLWALVESSVAGTDLVSDDIKVKHRLLILTESTGC